MSAITPKEKVVEKLSELLEVLKDRDSEGDYYTLIQSTLTIVRQDLVDVYNEESLHEFVIKQYVLNKLTEDLGVIYKTARAKNNLFRKIDKILSDVKP